MAKSAWNILFLNRKFFLYSYQIFFVINFSYFIIRFLLNSSIVKSDNERGKVNDKKNLIKKSDNEIGKFWNRKKSTGPYCAPPSIPTVLYNTALLTRPPMPGKKVVLAINLLRK